ncbi:MAG: hypothetical protein ABIQ47_09440 [Tepidiformaceae bacterium]
MAKRWLLVLVLIASASGLTWPAESAHADTQYFPGGVYWGKRYRNNYGSGCYDQYGSTSSCYQGTRAETYYYAHTVSVYETPRPWEPSIPGNYGGAFVWVQKSGISNLGTTDTSVSSVSSVSSDYDYHFDHQVWIDAKTANENGDTLSFVYTYDN